MTPRNYSFFCSGGGVFSRFLQCGIIPLADRDFDNVYLSPSAFWLEDPSGDLAVRQIILDRYQDAVDHGIDNPYDRLFNYFLDQNYDTSYQASGYLGEGTLYSSKNKIELSPRFGDYKQVLTKLRFKNSLLRDVRERSSKINWDKTLSVHVRLSTISRHGHDQAGFQDYLNMIEQALRGPDFNTVFVAADNDESVKKLQDRFGTSIKYNEDFHRMGGEEQTNLGWEYQHYFKKYYWTEAIMDAMMLGKAKKFICRTSNFSNAAILFGNFDEIQRL